MTASLEPWISVSEIIRCVRGVVLRGKATVPLPLGSPNAFTGRGDVAGSTDTRNPAGDWGVDVNGEEVSERVGLDVTGGGGGGGGGGKSCGKPAGEDKVLELRKGGGGGGKEGELGDSTLLPLDSSGCCWKGGSVTRLKGLWDVVGDSGLELEEVEDCVLYPIDPPLVVGLCAAMNCLGRA